MVQCEGEDGFVVVGGGGGVIGQPSPGALMTATLPLGEFLWEARFKTHGSSGSYQARAYAINLKVSDWSVDKLLSALVYVEKTSEFPGPAPNVSATLPAGYTLIGGGGYVLGAGPGILLNYSKPTTNGWRVGGNQHLYQDEGYARAVAIGIKSCFSGICFTSKANSEQGATVSSGYASSALNISAAAALTSIGGESVALDDSADDIDRFLTHLTPFAFGTVPGSLVRAKDRRIAVSGYVVAHTLSLRATASP
jgi:hypothetical protein